MIDAVVIGSGPNGLAAAVTLARAGLRVEVFEAAEAPGGGARTVRDATTDTHHDWGSAVHPMALASPFFRAFRITERVAFATPDISFAHPLPDVPPALAWRDLDRTADGLASLGHGADGVAWRRLFAPLVSRADRLTRLALSPLAESTLPVPRDPATAVAFARRVLRHGTPLAETAFRGRHAAALLTGVLAHAVAPLPSLATAASGLVLGTLAHAGGWPIPIGGSGAIVGALTADLEAHGGRIHTAHRIADLADLPAARSVFFDTSAAGMLALAADRLDPRYRRALTRFRPGAAAAKVDFVLSEPVPWSDPELARAGTLHLGGDRARIVAAERDVAHGVHPSDPYVLVNQPAPFDDTRAPTGRVTLWTYTHVPAGSDRDVTEAITGQIERVAPGFRDVIIASRCTTARELAQQNPNFEGGDIATGAVTLRQLLARPVFSRHPWRAGTGLYLCSAAAAPGPGVHGMGGYQAARLALREVFGLDLPGLAPTSDTPIATLE